MIARLKLIDFAVNLHKESMDKMFSCVLMNIVCSYEHTAVESRYTFYI